MKRVFVIVAPTILVAVCMCYLLAKPHREVLVNIGGPDIKSKGATVDGDPFFANTPRHKSPQKTLSKSGSGFQGFYTDEAFANFQTISITNGLLRVELRTKTGVNTNAVKQYLASCQDPPELLPQIAERYAEIQKLAKSLETGFSFEQVTNLLGSPTRLDRGTADTNQIALVYSPHPARTYWRNGDQFNLLKIYFDQSGKVVDWNYNNRPLYMATPHGDEQF